MTEDIARENEGADEDGAMRDATDARGGFQPEDQIRCMGRVRTTEQWELVRSELYPLIMQGFSQYEMAEKFQKSVETISRWKKKLLDEVREEAVNMQPGDFIMESIASLRDARAQAWREFHAASCGRERRACLQLINQTENQLGRLGERIGMFEEKGAPALHPRKYGVRGGDRSGIDVMREMMTDFLSTRDVLDAEEFKDLDALDGDDLSKELNGDQIEDASLAGEQPSSSHTRLTPPPLPPNRRRRPVLTSQPERQVPPPLPPNRRRRRPPPS